MSYLERRVGKFHVRMGLSDPTTPTLPEDDVAELRARLIGEESMETMCALVGPSRVVGIAIAMAEKARDAYLAKVERRKSPMTQSDRLVEIVDGCVDTMVVASGTLRQVGVHDAPIMKAVMDANDAKVGGGRDAFGKFKRPPGWSPPDILGELRKQGWTK